MSISFRSPLICHSYYSISKLRLDGSIIIAHPEGSTGVFSINQITRLHDGIEQLENDAWEHSDDHLSFDDAMDTSWYMDGDEDSQSSGDDDCMDNSHSETDSMLEVQDTILQSSESRVPTLVPPTPEPTEPVPTVPSHNPDKPKGQLERFDVLSSAPPDHAFISTVPSQPSRTFLSRINREYRSLIDGLPDSILVRAYEDRTDLLRSVIIGPETTPYENAPFVIDWLMDSNFPNSPPIAHFHSWTAGKGRINPNLYEEGKVCLSILGTWTGDRTESWSAARSSLLQALVSIQGLVLVREPWFCEPAYEKLRGTEDGVVNSRLYNEKAYVLSHNFVRQAIEFPISGFEDEIKLLYIHQGKLGQIIRNAQALIERSKDGSEPTIEEQEAAVPRLSSGGVLTLSRTLTKLQSLLDTSTMVSV
jgi:ubiquitin-conjugating enzyme E2 O